MDIEPVQTDNNEWPCTKCTFLNSNDTTICGACGISKDGNTTNSHAIWSCEGCRTLNMMSSSICMGCGLSMHGQQAPTTIRYDIPADIITPDRSMQDIMEYVLGTSLEPIMPPNMTPRQEAEYHIFGTNTCRCNRCKLRAMRSIINLFQTTSSPYQRMLADIMINEILPELAASTFQPDNPIMQFLNSDSIQPLQTILDRSFAEAEGAMRPASSEDMECLREVDIPSGGGAAYDSCQNTNCVICMEEFEADKEKKICSMPCQHIFHRQCIEQWLKNDASCPICKKRIDEEVGLIDTSETL